ncbi:MAG: HEAT repeat domain-containing protein, partial [Deltaproteobacteria bacterium]|nr:HEAT repeat domain-containing protein [Deltaproteobacteria bacterium]MBW2530826.1 HEAT repeat domain-containing protein [Deltaproteobacteria bacterium]
TTQAVIELLRSAPGWSLRARAAEALGVAAAEALPQPTAELADRALRRAALQDEFALVREAALKALAARGGSRLKPLFDRVAKNDAEPRLRQLARQLAEGMH